MLRALVELFDSLSAPASGSPRDDERRLQLATAVLLVEVMRAEPESRPGEREAVMAALRSRFALSSEELERLVTLAEEKSRTANDFFAFTSTLNDHFSQPEKVRVVELMWQVAYADGDLADNENHLISRVAGLLHVTHGEYIAAKLRAKQDAGLGAA